MSGRESTAQPHARLRFEYAEAAHSGEEGGAFAAYRCLRCETWAMRPLEGGRWQLAAPIGPD